METKTVTKTSKSVPVNPEPKDLNAFTIPVKVPKPADVKILQQAKDMAEEHPTQSKALALLTSALVQVELTMTKADEVIQTLQTNLGNVQGQKIGLQAQKTMLIELKTRLEDIEKLELSQKTTNE